MASPKSAHVEGAQLAILLIECRERDMSADLAGRDATFIW